MKRTITKFITCFLSAVLLLCTAMMMSGCTKKASDFTEEEHIARITERIKESNRTWSYPKGETYDDFQVYPIYDKDETLKYFLVEFNPHGFVFILLTNERPSFLAHLGACTSMYRLSNVYGNQHTWSPYITNGTDNSWLLDENGAQIYHNRSPYFISGNIDKKKYLLETNNGAEFICAVKQNDKFINLVSNVSFELTNNDFMNIQATLYIPFIAKGSFDL